MGPANKTPVRGKEHLPRFLYIIQVKFETYFSSNFIEIFTFDNKTLWR